MTKHISRRWRNCIFDVVFYVFAPRPFMSEFISYCFPFDPYKVMVEIYVLLFLCFDSFDSDKISAKCTKIKVSVKNSMHF
jgi:hypothetical protein